MLPDLVALAPFPPLLAALVVGVGMATGRLVGEGQERLTAQWVIGAALLSSGLVLTALLAKMAGELPVSVELGSWLESGDYRVGLNFVFDVPSLTLAALTVLMSPLVMRFSITYMHRETGYHRFFLVLALFNGAMLLLALAGNLMLTFMGWELAGVSSYLLIGYASDRPVAVANANRAFITNRIGDAGFMLGIVLSFTWAGGIDWNMLAAQAAHLGEWQAGTLAGCFLLAAMAKSAQGPFVPWLIRAMEGPTPSSAIFYGAVMVHAGVFLVLKLAPIFEQAPLLMGWMALMGLTTALYGFVCGLVQTDIKSALIFTTVTHVGLMFLAAGMGYWELTRWYLCAHAIFRGYQFLVSPSIIQHLAQTSSRSIHPWLARSRSLYAAAQERFWLENFTDWLLVRPIERLGKDFQTFDHQIVDRFFGLGDATFGGLTSLADLDSHRGLARPDPDVTRVSGLPGLWLRGVAQSLHWFEDRLVLQGVGLTLVAQGKQLGARLHHVEDLLSETRFLVLFIVATFLAVF